MIQIVDDGNGTSSIVSSNTEPSLTSSDFHNSFYDAVKSTRISTRVPGVVVIVAIVVIVYLMIRKARTAETSETSRLPRLPVLQDLQVEHATMEAFLKNMAREKLIRFSPKQLAGFTKNYSTRLGSSGFSVVFKGKFPNGAHVAVKVLSGELNKQVEEQFIADNSMPWGGRISLFLC